MRRAYTLIELIMVMVVASILSLGTFKALEALFVRSAKARAVTELSLASQVVLDQLSQLLYYRVPNSVIGYTPGGGCEAIEVLSSAHSIMEWLGTADESLLLGRYDGFVDLNASVNPNLSVPNINGASIIGDATAKIGSASLNLVFAGAFDAGTVGVSACSGAYGWHGNASALSHDIAFGANRITIAGTAPQYIYEKFYLVDTAYAVARGADIDSGAACITNLGVPVDANTLFLFYNYQPYAGETFCADPGGGGSGNAAVLSYDVQAFRAEYYNEAIRLGIDMNRSIRGASDVQITKQKVVF